MIKGLQLKPYSINPDHPATTTTHRDATYLQRRSWYRYWFYFCLVLCALCFTWAVIRQTFNRNLIRHLQQSIEPDNIRENLQYLTEKPHIAGSYQDEVVLVDFIKDKWDSFLDDVKVFPYDVILSYPNVSDPNYVGFVYPNGTYSFSSHSFEEQLIPHEDATHQAMGYNANSPPGDVIGAAYYVNYARVEDFQYLKKLSINLTGSICIARYGHVSRMDKASAAAKYNCSGLVLFSDPSDYAGCSKGSWNPNDTHNDTFPGSWWLPKDGFQRGTLHSNGDPSTPNYPSLDFIYREKLERNKKLPKIPVQPISYDDAFKLLETLDGTVPPSLWQGGFNMTYKIGGSFSSNGRVHLHVGNYFEMKTVHNVLGTITGHTEPDRYVLFGNHRDAWVHGGLDPNSGTAVMLEVSRVLGQTVQAGLWRPRRTLVFCSWGAEEHGLIGSTEWVEHFEKKLFRNAVAYINIDTAVHGSATFQGAATPSMYNVLLESTKSVPNPNSTEVESGRPSVFDTWVHNRPDDRDPARPFIRNLGSGSDYMGFLQKVGVPCVDLRYTYDEYISSYPVYHSLHDTFDYLVDFIDPDFKYSTAVAEVALAVMVELGDSRILPLSPLSYAAKLRNMLDDFSSEYGDVLSQKNITLTALHDCIDGFHQAAASLSAQIDVINPYTASELRIRQINDILFNIDKGFIDFSGLPGRPEYRHVIFAPSSHNLYSGAGFPAVVDAIYEAQRGLMEWDEVEKQISFLSQHVLQASMLMGTNLW